MVKKVMPRVTSAVSLGEGGKTMVEPKRVTAEEIHQRLKSGTALLVCAYEDDAKFKKLQLQGAISLNEFKSRLPSLAKPQEIVFYCA
jgi:hypothetical protein